VVRQKRIMKEKSYLVRTLKKNLWSPHQKKLQIKNKVTAILWKKKAVAVSLL